MTADLQNSSHRTRKYQSFDINKSNIIITAVFYARTVYSYFAEKTHRLHQRRMLKTHSSQPDMRYIKLLILTVCSVYKYPFRKAVVSTLNSAFEGKFSMFLTLIWAVSTAH